MFRTGVAPVSADETLELYAFMEAADESKRRGGAEVTLKEVLDKARAEVAAMVANAARLRNIQAGLGADPPEPIWCTRREISS